MRASVLQFGVAGVGFRVSGCGCGKEISLRVRGTVEAAVEGLVEGLMAYRGTSPIRKRPPL